MALVTRFFTHKHAKHPTNEKVGRTDGSLEQQQRQFLTISSSWKRLLTPKQEQKKGRWLPTFSSIIEAGDEGLISSTLFNELQIRPEEDVSLDALYEIFANQLRVRPLKERSAYSLEVAKFLSDSRQSVGSVKRANSVSQRHTRNVRPESISRLSRKSLDFSVVEGLSRSFSMKSPAPVLVSMRIGPHDDGDQKGTQGYWFGHGQISESHNGKLNMKITPAELAALSIVLGSPMQSDLERNVADTDLPASGVSLALTPLAGSRQQITFRRHKCSTSQRHAQGSGTSILYAKHLAVGSLPYSQDGLSISSILFDDTTFQAIRAGKPLSIISTTAKTPQSRLLASLPNSRQCDFHLLATSTEVDYSSTLSDAISTLPFKGGLVALGSTPLVNTIHFIASAGVPPMRLLQRLEGLVDKVNRFSPTLKIFGPLYEPSNAGVLYREHERLGKLATDKSVRDILADKTARMSRYITLLERLMALVPDLRPQEVLTAVQEATKSEIQLSYTNAVTAYAAGSAPTSPTTPGSHRSSNSDRRSRRKSAMSRVSDRGPDQISTASTPGTGSSSPRLSAELDRNLGKQMEQVLKMTLPLDIKTIAFVARMVIVAWTLSVGHVAWEQDEEGFRLPRLEDLSEKMVFC